MSDNDKTKTEIIVLQRIPSHQALMKSNRWLVRGVVFLMTVIFVGGYLALPKNDFLGQYKKITADDLYATADSPRLTAEVDSLKGQLVGLLSGSIESKLSSLEENLRAGTLNSSLGTIEALKNDVKVLRSYSEPVKKQATTTDGSVNEQLIQEMSHLKRLIYLSFASCGLMLAALASIWFKNVRKLPYKEMLVRYLNKQ